MSPEFYQRPGNIAVNHAVRNAKGCGKKPHAILNMVMRHLKNSQVAAAPEGLKVKHLDLNKRGACDLNKGVHVKSPPSNGCGNGCACTVSQF